MNIHQNVPLANYSTMRLGGPAQYLADVTSRQDLLDALAWAKQQEVSVRMIGSGSNIIWQDSGFQGLILVNKVMGFEQFDEDTENCYVTVGAGEQWDSVVERTVEAGLSGIECLSLIPGTAGATPVQNVGAYGQEVANTIVSLEVYDNQTQSFTTISGSECAFGYRTSRFKTIDVGRFYILRLTFHLSKIAPLPPFYSSLQDYLVQHDMHDYTPAVLRQAVIAIRSSKLPDPKVVANNGSFFANPIISENALTELQQKYPDIPHWDMGEGQEKIPAAWLLEHTGFKDFHDAETGMATWVNQPLVFVNENAKNTADLLAFKKKVVDAVQAAFGITLTQEPELLP